jgi:hypothetical protein
LRGEALFFLDFFAYFLHQGRKEGQSGEDKSQKLAADKLKPKLPLE